MIPNKRMRLVITLLTVAIAACGPGRAPTGQPPMVTKTTETLEALRQEFNAAPDAKRVVLLLSPT
jgi:hypothetical protein